MEINIAIFSMLFFTNDDNRFKNRKNIRSEANKLFTNEYLNTLFETTKARNSSQPEYLQAVEEFFEAMSFIVEQDPNIEKFGIMERIIEPERIVKFRVTWVDDNGNGGLISTIDVTSATNLTVLNVRYNQLAVLDISANPDLILLNVRGKRQLGDQFLNTSNNTLLTELWIEGS